jgi:hypothetical protein
MTSTRHYTIISEGEERPLDRGLQEFWEDNPDIGPQDRDALYHLQPGQEHTLGGGAVPPVTVRCENLNVGDALITLGFREEGTGGGCAAYVRRFPTNREILITDGNLGAPVHPAERCCAALINTDNGIADYQQEWEWPNARAMLAQLPEILGGL